MSFAPTPLDPNPQPPSTGVRSLDADSTASAQARPQAPARPEAPIRPEPHDLAPAAPAETVDAKQASELEGSASDRLQQAIGRACSLVPPLWTLRNFVAVNPFLGLSDEPFSDAVATVDRVKHGDALLRREEYLAYFEAGRISPADLDEAIAAAPGALGRPELAELAEDVIREAMLAPGSDVPERVGCYSELVDRVEGSDWSKLIVDEIAKWCAARFDRGQSSWPLPHAERPLYASWRALAQLDRGPEIKGLSDFRRFVASLPEESGACIEKLVAELGIPEQDVPDVLARALASVSGWAGHIQYRIRQATLAGKEPEDQLSDLLAIRLAFDAGLRHTRAGNAEIASWASAREAAHSLARKSFADAVNTDAADAQPGTLSKLEIRHLWQIAFEAGFRNGLVERVTAAREQPAAAPAEPLLQAAFCIDVRSEVLRRNLEQRSDRIQTLGFAGFFGLAIETVQDGDAAGQARCPVLLSPGYQVAPRDDRQPEKRKLRSRRDRYHSLVKHLRLSSVMAFPFVETIGQFFGMRLISDSLGWTRPGADSRLFSEPKAGHFEPVVSPESADDSLPTIALADRIALAEGILRNMGLTRGLAPYVLLCGHGSSTTNNPYGSSLDCGACGGYAGDVNARAAVALLNDPDVRKALAERGLEVPPSTRFLAGLHDTTTDEILLFDTEGLPTSELAAIRGWLGEGGAATRRERARRLGIDAAADVDGRVTRRSNDWSEIRPEWGLAGNAAFIAAPRARTRGIDLEGRCFLHDYHADRDPEGQVLELILTAPMVVASWINLQYFASTVDNETFGAGSKTIHNVVGRHGIVSGNGGDLRVGLPFQSVHDGERYAHEPLRLTALIEAPEARIAEILERNEGVRALIENQWISLLSIDPDSGVVSRWTRDGFRRLYDGKRAEH